MKSVPSDPRFYCIQNSTDKSRTRNFLGSKRNSEVKPDGIFRRNGPRGLADLADSLHRVLFPCRSQNVGPARVAAVFWILFVADWLLVGPRGSHPAAAVVGSDRETWSSRDWGSYGRTRLGIERWRLSVFFRSLPWELSRGSGNRNHHRSGRCVRLLGVHLSLTITKTKLKEAFKIFRIHKIRLLYKKTKIL